ncbi:HAMP domain-containing sensor histidine kinase [Acetohalobium arabaticum]|uniref:histidine kinase n=1 Tax=Acetohalobium arabaticum (strain ATCC 49924 / DSM 5501 / Z-7288) TaxID=574087 RepID=D9QQU6_ACEAZ|nr:ATP-binding protein [Acetohalobium arabaticum]ADL12887.1 multi-sensor signal transduction histidine kinase [Acetohalobium arabaticum DSM 5501]
MAKNLNLRTKILVGYLITVMIIIGVASWAIYNFVSLNESINDIMVENYRSVIAAEGMMEALERQDSAELIFVFGQQKKALDIFKKNQMQFMKHLSRAEDNITIDKEKKIIANLNQEYQNYLEMFSTLQRKADQSKLKEAQNFYLEEVMPQFEKIKTETRDLLLVNQNHMKTAQEKANDSAVKAVYSTAIFSVIATIFAILFGIYISNLIIKPVKELTATVKEIAAGNLDHEIKMDTKDEIGQLAHEFNSMTERLKEFEEMNVGKVIEEKNKSEAIVKSISNPLLVTDEENKVQLMNPKAEELFDLNEDNIVETHFLESIDEDRIFDLITETLDSGEEQVGKNNEVITFKPDNNDSKGHYFRINTTPVSDREGNTNLVVTLLEDITHLKEVDQMKSEFVSMVSHEFRTPLTSMNMGINMLLEENIGEINEEQKELLEVAKEDCEHLNNLVDDLLDLSKIESGEIDLEFDAVAVKKIFEASIQPFMTQAEEQGVDLITEETNGLEVYADFNKITWVITNLIGNALRYTGKGDKIKLLADKKGHKMHISVADTGEGIPKEYRHKIFKKFVRVGDDKDEETGTGLGLAISKEIIEAHGGRIWVESEVGEGSIFTFTLKLPK